MLLAEFVDKPITLPTSVWPEALTMASRAGAEATFSSLVAMSGSAFIATHGQRKREPDTPSLQN